MNNIRNPIQHVVLKSGGEWVPVTAKRHITAPKTGNLNILGIIVISGEGLKIELSRKKLERALGNQVSTFQFKRTAPGEYRLITTVPYGKESGKTIVHLRLTR
jgi:hypothetical protein